MCGGEIDKPNKIGMGDGTGAKSGFDIEVASGICEYVCSFLP